MIIGNIAFPGNDPRDFDKLTASDLGYADVRCDNCTSTHGSYQEGEAAFEAAGGSIDEFPVAVENAAGNVLAVVEAKQIEHDAAIDQRLADDAKGTKA